MLLKLKKYKSKRKKVKNHYRIRMNLKFLITIPPEEIDTTTQMKFLRCCQMFKKEEKLQFQNQNKKCRH